MKSALLVTTTAWFVCAITCDAAAQSADQKAAAEVLFNEARKAMNEGRHAEACPKLAESQSVDPGVGTLGWLAYCYEQTGRPASAWATYKETASIAAARGDAERARVANERAESLEPKLPRLTLDTSPVASVAGVEITRNGGAVVRSLWGSAIPVDPGEHLIELSAPGFAPAKVRVTIGAEDRRTVTLPELVPVPAATEPAAPPVAPATPAKAAADTDPAVPEPNVGRDAPPQESDTGATRVGGYALAGVGVVGLGLGVAFYLDRNGKLSDRDAACPEGPNLCATPSQVQTYSDHQDAAQTSATIATVSGIAGGVALGAGAILLLMSTGNTTANAVPVTPVVGRGFGGANMAVAW